MSFIIKIVEKMFSWEYGRQNTGYRKHTFFSSNFLKMDCHLLLYTNDTGIPPHKDEVVDGDHYRLNIILVKPKSGGIFYCNKNIWSIKDRIHLFRPDKYSHFVTPVVGSRLVLSIGKVI